jgi:hypothetical protein
MIGGEADCTRGKVEVAELSVCISEGPMMWCCTVSTAAGHWPAAAVLHDERTLPHWLHTGRQVVTRIVVSVTHIGGVDLAFVSRAAIFQVVCCMLSGPFLTGYTQVSKWSQQG